jgi:hypothetical protein
MAGRAHGPSALLLVLLLSAVSACQLPIGQAGPAAAAAAAEAPLAAENARPGSPGWTVSPHGTGISGYVVPASVRPGERVGIAVSTTSATYDLDYYRIGWYRAAGGRLVRTAHGLPGRNQGVWTPGTFGVAGCPTCLYDAQTGLLQPQWAITNSFTVPASWPSGDYVVRITTPAGDVAYAQFVVREDRSTSAVLAVLPLNTYEAYNDWGGKSLYGSNSTGPATLASGEFKLAATQVSLERPYASIDAARQDFETVAFLERSGFDATYATSVDVDRDPELLGRHRVVIFVGHDEYWSRAMRDDAESARDTGTNLIFLGGNDVFWQVRYGTGASGADHSVLICYRSASIDPIAATDPPDATVRFADPPLSRPESSLTGTTYTDPILKAPTDWVVAPTAPAWLTAGTRLVAGSAIKGLVGVECDRLDRNLPIPSTLVVVSSSPVLKSGVPSHCDSIYYQAPRGAQVFSAGTWSWEDFLDGSHQNADVVAMTNNLLERFGAPGRADRRSTPAGGRTRSPSS